jgi:hypothetical protein
VLDHVIAHGDLAIGNEHDFSLFSHTKDRCAVPLWLPTGILHPSSIPRGALGS